jgi:mRNA-degrading endonuclease RelE of RelBE toxin-antitoxin system
MKLVFTDPFRRDYRTLPAEVQRALDKALKFLLESPRHPSLRTKKIPGTEIWYARAGKAYRFTFQFRYEFITLRRVGTHAILTKERKHQS